MYFRVTKAAIRRIGIVGLLIVFLMWIIAFGVYNWIGFSRSSLSTLESRFKDLFAELCIRTPEYQGLFEVAHPSFALKGDYCILDFSQSRDQFQALAASLGVSEESILSVSGISIKINSKIDPKYPWEFRIQADHSDPPSTDYRVHIKGVQPYD